MMTSDWLLQWEPPQYFGKHDRRYPADNAIGYRFNPAVWGNDLWLYDRGRICRAIPVEGTLERLDWSNSPQVRFWLDEPQKGIWERLKAWWRR